MSMCAYCLFVRAYLVHTASGRARVWRMHFYLVDAMGVFRGFEGVCVNRGPLYSPHWQSQPHACLAGWWGSSQLAAQWPRLFVRLVGRLLASRLSVPVRLVGPGSTTAVAMAAQPAWMSGGCKPPLLV